MSDGPRDRKGGGGTASSATESLRSATESLESLYQRTTHVSGAAPRSGTSGLGVGTKLSDGRLTIIRRLGEGGMGVVYEAYDAQRNARVALKTLTRMDAVGVYRLKNEFRVLADVRHDNLVALHELWNDGELWCFTMELVDGVRFDHWVRASGDDRDAIEEARLRAALPQLVEAVSAIHAAGKVHRDLKPSNVLMTPEGRAVVLDFGLAVDPEAGGVGRTLADEGVSGTPAYMAPEQAAGAPAVAASDFYALGVMLFEALTGRLPFQGRAGEILAAKQRDTPPRASEVYAGVAPDLDQLCVELLAREPSARPDAAALRERVGVPRSQRSRSSSRLRVTTTTGAARAEPSIPPEVAPELLGRERELGALREAFEATLGGQAVVLFVSGESGMGKSTLCQAFLHELRAQGRATVLAGRCYERENVPFKGFDSLVDDVSRHLRRLPPNEAAAVLPREVHALSRLFPVLERVDAVADAPKKHVADPQELRRRAFAAFGELMVRIRDRTPLCVHLDDLQWLDTDAVLFMRALMVHPQPVPALLVLSHRSEGAAHNQALLRVRDAIEGNSHLQLRTLGVEPLTHAAASDLAARLLSDVAGAGDAAVAAIARESGGSPFFVGELAQFVARHGGDAQALGRLSLRAALDDNLSALSASARRLLEHSALAGKPLPARLLLRAAQATHVELDRLRASHLVRLSDLEGSPLVECYHDKVRETVAGALGELQRVATFATLAAALEPHASIDPELLATCFEGAGQRGRAAEHCVRAAEQAMTGTAFLHAAGLYERALALGTWDQAREHALRVAQGDALAQAGRGKQAAEVLLRATSGAPRDEVRELRRRAALELFTTGHTEEGMALFRELFRELGVSIPRSPGAALPRLIVSQLRLRVRGLDYEPRPASAVSAEKLQILETERAAISGLSSHAPLIAAAVADDLLLRALDSGVSEYVAHALAQQANFLSHASPLAADRITHLHDTALRIAREHDDAALLGRVEMLTGNACINRGLWRRGREHEARALEILRGKAHGVQWVIDGAQLYDQVAAFARGDLRDVARVTPSVIEHGFSRDRIWVGAVMSGQFGSAAWLCGGDVSGYLRILESARTRWRPQADAQWPDYFIAFGEVAVNLYRGEPLLASTHVERSWPWLARSLVVRAQAAHMFGLLLRGTAAASALRAGGDASRSSIVKDCSKRLARLDLAGAACFRDILDAGLALHARDTELGARHLRAAIAGLEGCDMALYAAAARRRLGELLGGEEGAMLLAQGDAAMRGQDIVDLDAMTEMLCGGCRSVA